jgi:BirA family biotin operon repressor/biotin-[acetyl-CoA-carboxylase] ligase
VSRNRLAGLLLTALWSGLRQFERQGFEAFIDEWRRQDYLSDKLVSIRDADGIRRGFARGIGPDGSLLVETASGITPLLSGEVSVRHAA